MNENINLLEILKDAPKGIKLWSPIFGECEFQGIYTNKSPIICTHTIKEYVLDNNIHEFADFLCDGRLATCCSEDGECLLFPSKDNRDWSTFIAPWKHKYFKPFQKVLIPGIMDNVYYWSANFYSHYDKKHRVHYLIDGETINDDDYIISYEGNEDKLSKRI